MKQEPALMLSIVIGGIVAGLISLLGDAHSQYIFLLVAASYPFFILMAAAIILSARFILIKTKMHMMLSYILSGGVLGCTLGMLVTNSGGGVISGVSLGIGIFMSFLLFSLLIFKRSEVGNNA